MTEGPPPTTATRSPPPPAPPAYCPQCSYDLCSHPQRGACPECGRAYDKNDGLLLRLPAPGIVRLLFMFGWPYLILVTAGVESLVFDSITFYAVILPVLALSIVNSLVTSVVLVRRRLTPGHGRPGFSTVMRQMSRFAMPLFVLTVVAPFLFLGGCLLLVIVISASL